MQEQTTRQCLVTRDNLSKAEMIRFVLSPDDCVVPDLKMRLPGRGVWVKANRDLVDEAVRKNLFSRGFKQAVTIDENLSDLIGKQMEKRCLSALSMTKKAGQIVTGFTKVQSSIAQYRPYGLIHAVEAAEDGQRKLAQTMRRYYGSETGCPIIRYFSAEKLSMALGLENVIHAALLAGSASQGFLDLGIRLEAYHATTKQDL